MIRISPADIVPYLRCGGREPVGALATRIDELLREAPLAPAGCWARVLFQDAPAVFLCGTLGAAFDAWHRRLAATSAADALIAQAIGTAWVEAEMDALEAEAARSLADGETLSPRRSPGYGDMPLGLSAEILKTLDATKKLGVALTPANLLVPTKSVTAVCRIG